MLYVLERSFSVEDKVPPLARERQGQLMGIQRYQNPRTAIQLCCTAEQAARIRRYAASRELSISAFVVFSLRRVWKADDRFREGAAPRRSPSTHIFPFPLSPRASSTILTKTSRRSFGWFWRRCMGRVVEGCRAGAPKGIERSGRCGVTGIDGRSAQSIPPGRGVTPRNRPAIAVCGSMCIFFLC